MRKIEEPNNCYQIFQLKVKNNGTLSIVKLSSNATAYYVRSNTLLKSSCKVTRSKSPSNFLHGHCKMVSNTFTEMHQLLHI